MVKHSWPFAVTSWDDTVKIAQLLLGTDVRIKMYASRLPEASEESLVLFARGACKAWRCQVALRIFVDLISVQLSEIVEYEKVKRNNHQNPLKSQQLSEVARGAQVYYSDQVTCAPCLCRSVFGADAHQVCIQPSFFESKSWQWLCETLRYSADVRHFESFWDSTSSSCVVDEIVKRQAL